MLHERGVLLSTYGMVLHNADSLAGAGSGSAQQGDGGAPLWDVVILDEVRLASPAGCTVSCSAEYHVRMRSAELQQPLLLRSIYHLGWLSIAERLFSIEVCLYMP